MAGNSQGLSQFADIRYLLAGIFIVILVVSSLILLLYHHSLESSISWTMCQMTWGHCNFEEDHIALNLLSVVTGLSAMGLVSLMVITAVTHVLSRGIGGNKMIESISKMKGHVLVCGYGRVGKAVCNVLLQNKVPFVVIENDPLLEESNHGNSLLFIRGDATDPAVLEKAGIRHASSVITVLGANADNVFVTLTAKELNPALTIASRAKSQDVVSKLHRAGADIVVSPEFVGGIELAREVLKLGKSEHELISKK